MKVSARNVFETTIVSIKEGPVSAEVELRLPSGDTLVAGVTEGSVHSLGLAVGKPALAFVKAPLVTLATNTAGWRFSARNQLAGTVTAVTTGAVNASVAIALAGGTSLSSVVTHQAVDELGLRPGAAVLALFKASAVVLALQD